MLKSAVQTGSFGSCWSARTYTNVRPHLHAVTHQADLQQESFNQLSY